LPEPDIVATPIPHAPQVIASFAAPAATYQAVSQHDAAEEEAHRPVRRRQREVSAASTAEPLQLVETANDKAAPPPVFEDEISRPPVRRRRQSQPAAPAEPLQLVETAPGASGPDGVPPLA
jgi:hypothetical protein